MAKTLEVCGRQPHACKGSRRKMVVAMDAEGGDLLLGKERPQTRDSGK